MPTPRRKTPGPKWGFNPGPSYCEAVVLTTKPLCCSLGACGVHNSVNAGFPNCRNFKYKPTQELQVPGTKIPGRLFKGPFGELETNQLKMLFSLLPFFFLIKKSSNHLLLCVNW